MLWTIAYVPENIIGSIASRRWAVLENVDWLVEERRRDFLRVFSSTPLSKRLDCLGYSIHRTARLAASDVVILIVAFFLSLEPCLFYSSMNADQTSHPMMKIWEYRKRGRRGNLLTSILSLDLVAHRSIGFLSRPCWMLSPRGQKSSIDWTGESINEFDDQILMDFSRRLCVLRSFSFPDSGLTSFSDRFYHNAQGNLISCSSIYIIDSSFVWWTDSNRSSLLAKWFLLIDQQWIPLDQEDEEITLDVPPAEYQWRRVLHHPLASSMIIS